MTYQNITILNKFKNHKHKILYYENIIRILLTF